MILRVFRGLVRAGREADLEAFIRDRVVRDVLPIPGLVSWQPGTRQTAQGAELVLVSTWTEIDSLLALRRDLNTPVAVPSLTDIVEHGRADHYEVIAGGARGIPLTGGRLRVVQGRLAPAREAAYMDSLRAEAMPLLDERALVSLHVGRRVGVGFNEALVASLWAHGSGESALLEPPAAFDEAPQVAVYDAMSLVAHAEEAPAILLADDERRYVYASPAAATLAGRPLARLLTMRIDDLAPAEAKAAVPGMWTSFLERGFLEGPFALVRPDGTQVEVRYSARARYPWPGCHASMLVPVGVGEAPDIEAALAAAGVVSRQPTAI